MTDVAVRLAITSETHPDAHVRQVANDALAEIMAMHERHDAVMDAMLDLIRATTDCYKAGRIPAEPFVRARNVYANGGVV